MTNSVDSRKRKFSLDEEADHIPISQNFPVFHITKEDIIEMAKKPSAENPFSCEHLCRFQDDPLIIIYPYSIYSSGDRIWSGDGTILSSHPDEKIVFIRMNYAEQQQQHSNVRDTWKTYIVITNFGSIFTRSFGKQISSSHPGLFERIPQPNCYGLTINHAQVLEDDKFCRVPQVFVKVMIMMTQLLQDQNKPGYHKPSTEINFKDLCREYNKSRKDEAFKLKEVEEQRLEMEKKVEEQRLDMERKVEEQRLEMEKKMQEQRLDMEKKMEEQRLDMEKNTLLRKWW